MYRAGNICNACRAYPCSYCVNTPTNNSDFSSQYTNEYIPFTDEMEYDSRFDYRQSAEEDGLIELRDYGPEPFVVNIREKYLRIYQLIIKIKYKTSFINRKVPVFKKIL